LSSQALHSLIHCATRRARTHFALGWAAAADKRCELRTYRIFLNLAKSHGLTDIEIAQNAPKVVDAALQADDEINATGLQQWCANYRRGVLTGQ
jgi:hypothetical protein